MPSTISGTKGSHIRNIIKFSGSSVKIASQEEEEAAAGGSQAAPPAADASPGSEVAPTSVTAAIANQRRVTIVGGPEAQWKAQYLIFQKLREEGFSTGGEDIRLTVEILVPSAQVRVIFGILEFGILFNAIFPGWPNYWQGRHQCPRDAENYRGCDKTSRAGEKKEKSFFDFSHEIFLQGTSTGEETSVHIVGSFYSIQVSSIFIKVELIHD